MAKRTRPTESTLAPLEELPYNVFHLLLDRYCCDSGCNVTNSKLVRVVRALSHSVDALVHKAFRHGRCKRMQCASPVIGPYDEYYMLGGGRVVNCAQCACNGTYTIMFEGKPREFRRGWDEPAKQSWLKLKRLMIRMEADAHEKQYLYRADTQKQLEAARAQVERLGIRHRVDELWLTMRCDAVQHKQLTTGAQKIDVIQDE